MEKFGWLGVLTKVIEVFLYIYSGGVLYNDLKANNIVFEERENWLVNLVILDFGKVRFASDVKFAVVVVILKRGVY